MASFLDFTVVDSKGSPSTMRIPITDQAVPADVVTYATAVAAAIFGAGKLSLGGYKSVSLVIPDVIASLAAVAGTEIRNKWQATMLLAGLPVSRFSIPARNPLDSLIVAGTGIAGDLSQSPFTSALAALIASGGAVHMLEADEDSVITAWAPVLAQTRARKRPRVGGTR